MRQIAISHGTATAGHPRHRLDPVVHSPVRLSIIAVLMAAERAEFAFVRDTVEVSDSVLSKQVSVLEEAGYLKVRKGAVGRRTRTWLSLSAAGRRAFEAHLAALNDIASSTRGQGGAASETGSAAGRP
ncbi:MAG: winged helix-turn-helix domain-containing protein [Acidimicrobiales bacterium]